jgi:hypothetical protein
MFASKQYTSADPIDNIRIRVRLNVIEQGGNVSEQRVSRWINQLQESFMQENMADEEEDDAQPSPSGDAADGMNAGSSSRDIGPRGRGKEEDSGDGLIGHALVEERVFAWQQKVFSPAELAQYQQMEKPATGLEKLYMDEVKAGIDASKIGKTLFTYVDKDNFEDPMKSEAMTDADYEYASPLAVNHQLRSKLLLSKHACTMYLMAHFEYLADMDPSSAEFKRLEEEERQARLADGHARQGAADEYANRKKQKVSEQVVLCRIVDNADGSFTARPGFHPAWQSTDGPSLGDYNRIYLKNGDIYEYNVTIANERKKDDLGEEFARLRLMQEMAESRLAMRENMIPSEFTEISADRQTVRLHVFGEIVSARDFHGQFCYARYIFDYSDVSWDTMHPESATAEATSHLASALDGVYLLGFPFTMHLEARTSVTSLQWPRVLFEVSTVDRLNRHRVEGYGYVNVPLEGGYSLVKMRMWKPKGSLAMQMKSYLLGGASVLRDPTYTSIPQAHQGSTLAKYGFLTEPTGELTVRMNVAIQASEAIRQAEASRFASPLKKASIFRGATTPDAVAGAFRRSRKARARQSKSKKEE